MKWVERNSVNLWNLQIRWNHTHCHCNWKLDNCKDDCFIQQIVILIVKVFLLNCSPPSEVGLNPTIREGLLKPLLNKNRVFGNFLWSKCPEKIWLFPNIYDNASHTLLGSQNGLKTGLSLSVCLMSKLLLFKFYSANLLFSISQN